MQLLFGGAETEYAGTTRTMIDKRDLEKNIINPGLRRQGDEGREQIIKD